MTKRTRGIPSAQADGFDEKGLRGASSGVGFLGVEPPIKLTTFLGLLAVAVIGITLFRFFA